MQFLTVLVMYEKTIGVIQITKSLRNLENTKKVYS